MPKRVLKEIKNVGSLQTIKCCCGAEILLVPNVKLMSEAIETHVIEHMRKLEGSEDAEAEAERIRSDLIAKVLSKACET